MSAASVSGGSRLPGFRIALGVEYGQDHDLPVVGFEEKGVGKAPDESLSGIAQGDGKSLGILPDAGDGLIQTVHQFGVEADSLAGIPGRRLVQFGIRLRVKPNTHGGYWGFRKAALISSQVRPASGFAW